MTKNNVITEDAKFNFISLIKQLGHPSIPLGRQLGLDRSIYDHFLTERNVKNRKSSSIILYLLDFGIKCEMDAASILQENLLEFCTREVGWDPDFMSEDRDQMISVIEKRWTKKLTAVIHNLQHSKTDLNFRLKDLLTGLNEVIKISFTNSNIVFYIQTGIHVFKHTYLSGIQLQICVWM